MPGRLVIVCLAAALAAGCAAKNTGTATGTTTGAVHLRSCDDGGTGGVVIDGVCL